MWKRRHPEEAQRCPGKQWMKQSFMDLAKAVVRPGRESRNE